MSTTATGTNTYAYTATYGFENLTTTNIGITPNLNCPSLPTQPVIACSLHNVSTYPFVCDASLPLYPDSTCTTNATMSEITYFGNKNHTNQNLIFKWSYFDGCITQHYCDPTNTFNLNHLVMPCCTNYQVVNGTTWYQQITNANETLGVYADWINDMAGDCALNSAQITGNVFEQGVQASFSSVTDTTFVPHV